MAKVAIAIHACGFESKDKICKALRSRIQRAIRTLFHFTRQWDGEAIIIITGGVPYEKNSKLLAYCAGDYLDSLLGDRSCPIFYAVNCFNSSTDTRDVLDICKKQKVQRLIVVTSFWHNWLVRQMYSHWNASGLLYIEFASPPSRDEAGMKTIIKYAVSGLIMLVSRITGFFYHLDKKLYDSQKKRREEFKETGCD